MNFKKIAEKFKNFLADLQKLPDKKKKIILWTVVAIFAALMGLFWLMELSDGISKLSKKAQNINLPEINLPKMPDIKDLNLQGAGNKSNQTSDWKIYVNSKYGFSIKYPTDWDLREYDTKTGAAFFPKDKSDENTTGNGSINIGFLSRGADYCKIPFDDYVKIAGPSEIESYNSVNTINSGNNNNGIKMYGITWNYVDHQGNEKVSLPITYFNTGLILCGSIEIFLNDNNYSDIYNNIISSFNFTPVK